MLDTCYSFNRKSEGISVFQDNVFFGIPSFFFYLQKQCFIFPLIFFIK